jgi:hypothetical protein
MTYSFSPTLELRDKHQATDVICLLRERGFINMKQAVLLLIDEDSELVEALVSDWISGRNVIVSSWQGRDPPTSGGVGFTTNEAKT